MFVWTNCCELNEAVPGAGNVRGTRLTVPDWDLTSLERFTDDAVRISAWPLFQDTWLADGNPDVVRVWPYSWGATRI